MLYGLSDIAVCHERRLVAFWLSCRPTVVDLDTWESLVFSLAPGWRWTTGTSRDRPYPALRLADGRAVKAARVIVGATRHQEVGARNGDPFDLRRCNVTVTQCSRRRIAAPSLV